MELDVRDRKSQPEGIDVTYAQDRVSSLTWVSRLTILAILISITQIVLNSIHLSKQTLELVQALLGGSVVFLIATAIIFYWARQTTNAFRASGELFQPRANESLTKFIFIASLILAGAALVFWVNLFVQRAFPEDFAVAQASTAEFWTRSFGDSSFDSVTSFFSGSFITQLVFHGILFFYFLFVARTAFRCLKWDNQAISSLVFIGCVLLLGFGLCLVYFSHHAIAYTDYPQVKAHFPIWNLRSLFLVGIAVSALSLLGFLADHRSWRIGFLVLGFLLLFGLVLLANFTGFAYKHTRTTYNYYKGTQSINNCINRLYVVDAAELQSQGCPAKYVVSDQCEAANRVTVSEKYNPHPEGRAIHATLSDSRQASADALPSRTAAPTNQTTETPSEETPTETTPVETPSETEETVAAPTDETTPTETAPAETEETTTAPAETTTPTETTPVETVPTETEESAEPTPAETTTTTTTETTPVEATPTETEEAGEATVETTPAATNATTTNTTTPVQTTPVESSEETEESTEPIPASETTTTTSTETTPAETEESGEATVEPTTPAANATTTNTTTPVQTTPVESSEETEESTEPIPAAETTTTTSTETTPAETEESGEAIVEPTPAETTTPAATNATTTNTTTPVQTTPVESSEETEESTEPIPAAETTTTTPTETTPAETEESGEAIVEPTTPSATNTTTTSTETTPVESAETEENVESTPAAETTTTTTTTTETTQVETTPAETEETTDETPAQNAQPAGNHTNVTNVVNTTTQTTVVPEETEENLEEAAAMLTLLTDEYTDSGSYCLNTNCCGILGQVYTRDLLTVANFALLTILAGVLIIIGCAYFWSVNWIDSARNKGRDYIYLGIMLVIIAGYAFIQANVSVPLVAENVGANGVHQ